MRNLRAAHLRPTSSDGSAAAATSAVYGAYVVMSCQSQLKRVARRLSHSSGVFTWSKEATRCTLGQLANRLSIACASALLKPAHGCGIEDRHIACPQYSMACFSGTVCSHVQLQSVLWEAPGPSMLCSMTYSRWSEASRWIMPNKLSKSRPLSAHATMNMSG